MPKASCPACSVAVEVKPEWSGRRVRCPKCKQSFQVPLTGAADAEDGFADPPSVNWLVLASAVVISLAVGGAAGFIVGHRQGKSDDVRELNEAKTRAEAAIQRQKSLEAEFASTTSERSKEKDRFEALMRARDQQLVEAQGDAAQAKVQAKAAEDKLEALLAKSQREAEDMKRAEAGKKQIPAVPLTEERKLKSEADAEYVNRKLQSTNRSILKGMSMLLGFNSLCEQDNVTKESIARLVGDDRDLLFTAGQMLADVGSYIPSKSKKGLTLQESWDICMEALGVKK